jgi:uncharacterized protein involved in type VI secretion and phage assembly
MSHPKGVLTAFVKKVDVEQGRIKVEYRSIEDQLESAWAWIASPLSGNKRGQLFMPEEGDEALIAFADNHFDHPFVLGFLWNGKQKSPETEVTNRVIVTPGGHQLRFEDKKDDTRVILKSKGKHQILLEDKQSGPVVHIKTNGNREVLLDDTQAAGKIRIKSDQNEILMDDAPGAAKVEIKAGSAGVKITMNTTPGSITIDASGGNSLKIDSTGTTLTSVGTLTINAAGAETVSIGGAASVTIGGAATITVGGAATITAGGAATITAGGAVSLTASALSVTAGATIFSGVVVATTLVAATVVGGTYTPSVGNLI